MSLIILFLSCCYHVFNVSFSSRSVITSLGKRADCFCYHTLVFVSSVRTGLTFYWCLGQTASFDYGTPWDFIILFKGQFNFCVK